MNQHGSPAADGERPAFRRSGRIVFTLLAVLVFVGLAPLATVAWKLIETNRLALTTAQQEYQLLLARAITHEVDIHVDGLRAQLVRVAQTLGGAMRRSGSSRERELKRILDDVVDDRMTYLRYAYFQGDAVQSFSAGRLPDKLEPAFASGLRDAAEILAQSAQTRATRAIVSDPILLDSVPPRAVLVISAPVVTGGQFGGVLSAAVDLQAMWDSVVARNITGHVVFALDSSGYVIASTSPLKVRPGQDASHSELVRRFLTAEGRARETMPFVENENGVEQRYIGSYEVTQHGWGIFVQARIEEVYLPVQDMVQSTLTWALAALGMAIVAAVVFASTLSRPIKSLAAASRAFAKGDFSTRVQSRSGNEIGELAHTFNAMADEIEDHIRRLRHAAEENRELFFGTIRALAQAIDAKDPYTRGHSMRVNRYSVIIARQLGLSESEVRDIHVSSLMHDVGKIGIDDAILKKPGKLSEQEFEVMKTHPVLGANIMAPIRRMKPILPGLRWHHERSDGSGYPDGLTEDRIPLMARIIAVADTFDAMTTHRPYQTAWSFDRAVARINELKNSAYDARIVEAFNRAYRQGLIRPDGEEAAAPPAAVELGAAAQ